MAAEQAFAKARAPLAQELLEGRWMTVGLVIHPDYRMMGGYWPDGLHPYMNYPGRFRSFRKFTSINDAFHAQTLSAYAEAVGAESGNIYVSDRYPVHLSTTGLHYEIGASKGDCQSRIECRIVQETEMLLCASITEDSRKKCEIYPRGRVVVYLGQIHIQSESVSNLGK